MHRSRSWLKRKLLNIDGKNSIPDLMDDTLDIEPPQRAAKDYER